MASTLLVNGAHYFASQTINGCESMTRLDVLVSVESPAPPTGNNAQAFCSGATVANMSATGTALKWYSTSTGGSALSASTLLVDGSKYYASQTLNGCESQTRLEVVVSMSTTAPAGNASQSFCIGATLANVLVMGTATKWYSAATGGSPLPLTTPLVDGVNYYASQTVNGCESQARLSVTTTLGSRTVKPTGISVQGFCTGGTLANLTVSGTSVKWYNTVAGGSSLPITTLLVHGTHYYASQTLNGCESQSRLNVTASLVTTVMPSGSDSQVFCKSATVANLLANGTAVKWYAEPAGGSPLSASTPLVGEGHYYASQTFNGCESQSRLHVVAGIVTATAPSGDAEQQVCVMARLTNLKVNGSNIKWYANPAGGTVLPATTVVVDGASYFASQTLNTCESPERLKVTAWTNTVPPAPSGQPAQVLFNGKTIADLVVSGSNITWYRTYEDALAGRNHIPSTEKLSTKVTYFATQKLSGCESAPFAVTVSLTTTGSQTADGDFVTGVETVDALWELFPNPVRSILSISHNQIIEHVTVSTQFGQNVIVKTVKDKKTEIDMSGLEGGVYFVKITLNDVVLIRKVLKL